MVGKEEQLLIISIVALVLIFLGFQWGGFLGSEDKENKESVTTVKMNSNSDNSGMIKLPEPKKESDVSVEGAIAGRRSRRSYRDEKLSLEEISQLLWAAQGITGEGGFKRAAPSAGATYPLELFLVAGEVENLKPGIYRYQPEEHSLEKVKEGDLRGKLAQAALGQNFIAQAPVAIVFTAIYDRTTGKYGERGIRYVHIETGHAAQNIYLECESLNLGTVIVGAFHDEEVKEVLNLKQEEPLCIMPVGRI